MTNPIASITLALAASLLFASVAPAQEQTWHHATAMLGEPKYPENFPRFDYANPDAPKGGMLRLSEEGTFDSFNPVLAKGEQAAGLALVFDPLMRSADDEISASYGLIAESISFPDDISEATFRIRAEARWPDGEPITPEDVIFSFTKAKEHNPLQANYYGHVVSAEKSGARDVTFRFDEINNSELPQILGQLLILPQHWWQGKDKDGNQRDIGRTTLEPVMGSGPYRIAGFTAGSTIRYELRDDYWARDLNVNVGHHNFGTIEYGYFTDRNVEFEAFRGGAIDFRQENSASRWATAYDFPAIDTGDVVLEEIENPLRAVGIMQAMVPNMRRDKFKDIRVRKALNFAFDFEDLNRNLAFDAFERIDSYFWGTELASSGLPEGREKQILESLGDKVPPEVFTTVYTNPVSGDPAKSRANLRQALTLFRDAGYKLENQQLVDARTGAPFEIEILLSSPSFERSVLPYVSNLKKIGVNARIRTVDASQYTNRVRSFDYDMIWGLWAQSLNPGNEQSGYWGSDSLEREGSRNYAGISDPAIDALIKMVIFAPNRDEQIAAVHALDRVLLAHHFVVPLFYSNAVKVAYRKTLVHPEELPYYGLGFPEVWWSSEAN
ncbi:extracellular solute-binding protein [Hoeflea sp. YIM 152468]|uniref:extracellular solute-binding protein n=1 Tax=Hoeflea sp. YIM 152468 TaxID=3031759 RepID=UPI0023DA816F|nr:extracellular solute-binding protein [Hoeflea sp. YIM 152468]MDF1610346.1 extracellular solute-binding protein [Hoeflea sp. YIM 152468]